MPRFVTEISLWFLQHPRPLPNTCPPHLQSLQPRGLKRGQKMANCTMIKDGMFLVNTDYSLESQKNHLERGLGLSIVVISEHGCCLTKGGGAFRSCQESWIDTAFQLSEGSVSPKRVLLVVAPLLAPCCCHRTRTCGAPVDWDEGLCPSLPPLNCTPVC